MVRFSIYSQKTFKPIVQIIIFLTIIRSRIYIFSKTYFYFIINYLAKFKTSNLNHRKNICVNG